MNDWRDFEMSMISEQINKIRKVAKCVYLTTDKEVADDISGTLNQAADTIEILSAKLQAVNMERSNRYCGEEKELIESMMVEIENCYNRTTELTERARKYLNKTDYCGGWIACEDRLPDTDDTVLIDTGIGYFEIATYSGDGKTFYTEECGSSCPVAWQYLPEPYRP